MTSQSPFTGSPGAGVFLLALLGLTSAFTACGDKDTDEGADTASSDTEPTEPDPEPEGLCPTPTLPEVLSSTALTFETRATAAGYAAATTEEGAVVANTMLGITALVPWDAEDGIIENEATWTSLEPDGSIDIITRSGDWLGVADGAWTLIEEGEAPKANAGTLRAIRLEDVGELTSDDFTDIPPGPWAFTIRGAYEEGYVGAMLVADLDGDGLDDVLTSSSPLPGELAMWSAIDGLSGELEWTSADVMTEACWGEGRNIYAPTSFAIFGEGDDGDGWLAVGCPGLGYGGSQVLVFALPLTENAEPVAELGPTEADPDAEAFAGWWLSSAGPGFPLYADNRRNGEVVIVRDDPSAVGTFTQERYTSPDGAGDRFGSTPSVYVNPETGCGLLAVGDQSGEVKGDMTGAVYLASLTGDGTPYEWVSLTVPSAEGVEPIAAGAVVRLSADGQRLVTTGWKWNGSEGGYVGLIELGPLE